MLWIDLSHVGLRLDACIEPDGTPFTVLRGAAAHAGAASSLGYAPDADGHWRRPGDAPSFTDVAAVFPCVDVAEVEWADVEFPHDAEFTPFPRAADAGLRRGGWAAGNAAYREAVLLAQGFDAAAFDLHLRAEGILPEHRLRYRTAAEALQRTLGPERFPETLRLNENPRDILAAFVARGGERRLTTVGLMEYACIHLKEFQHGLDRKAELPPPAASDRVLLKGARGFAAALQGGRWLDEHRSNLQKVFKLFGARFVAEALHHLPHARVEVFESVRTAHLTVSTRSHTWLPVRGLATDGAARYAALAAWDVTLLPDWNAADGPMRP